MSNLPVNWVKARIEDLISNDGIFSDGDWVERKDQDPNGGIRLLQLADIGDGVFLDKSERFVNSKTFDELRFTEIREDDVLVARMPNPLGRSCLLPNLPQRCITVVDVAIIRPGSDSVSPSWLVYFLNSPEIREEIELLATGTTRQRISRKNLGKIELPIPPLAEQRRIATKLDALIMQINECRNRLDRIPQILQQFRQTVLDEAVSGRLTRDWGETYNSTLVGNRLIRNLDEVVRQLKTGPFGSSLGKRDYVTNGIPVINPTHINNGKLTPDYNVTVSVNKAQMLSEFRMTTGDIVLGRRGIMGRCAVIGAKEDGWMCGSGSMFIRPKVEIILPEYLQICLSSPDIVTTLESNAVGSTMANLNQKVLLDLNIPVPTLAEQNQIVRKVTILFNHAEQIESRYRQATHIVEQLVPSILDKGFRGELVEQDPDDEPASILLERVKEQKALQTEIESKSQKQSQTSTMARQKQAQPKNKEPQSVISVLRDIDQELSSSELLEAAGYPQDADSDLVEMFLVEIRDSLNIGAIKRDRRDNQDWFSMANR